MNLLLKQFKDGPGFNFPALLSIPERLPAMAKRDPQKTGALVVVALTNAFEAMNLSRPMNSAQIVELAETIIDSSEEDYLALEDLLLFLQGLTRGKYGPLYESMDIPKFMQMFEVYRVDRHREYQSIKEERQSNFKSMGDPARASENNQERESHREALGEHLKHLYKDEPK